LRLNEIPQRSREISAENSRRIGDTKRYMSKFVLPVMRHKRWILRHSADERIRSCPGLGTFLSQATCREHRQLDSLENCPS